MALVAGLGPDVVTDNALNKALPQKRPKTESGVIPADVDSGLKPNTVTHCASSRRGSERRFRRRYVMRGRPEAVDFLHGRCRSEGAALDQSWLGDIASEAFANAGASPCSSARPGS